MLTDKKQTKDHRPMFEAAVVLNKHKIVKSYFLVTPILRSTKTKTRELQSGGKNSHIYESFCEPCKCSRSPSNFNFQTKLWHNEVEITGC